MNDKIAALYPDHLKTVRERFDRALAAAKFDRVAIFSGAPHPVFLDDTSYPFKANPHFKTWVPVVDNPYCFVLYTPGRKPRLVYYQPIDYWYMPAEKPTGFWVDQFDIDIITEPDQAQSLVASERTVLLGEPSDELHGWTFGDINPKPFLERLHFERAWKTPYEIECMRQATAIGVRGHRAAERAFRAGASEYEIHVEYLRATNHSEQELPYGNIVALNQHAAVLHYQNLDRTPKAKEQRFSFLIDAGGSFNGYASDITRTYSAKSDEFQEFIDAMDRKQQELCAMVRPGVDYRDIHMQAHRNAGEILQKFGVINVDAETAVKERITSTFFPHGVGHYLGLQVHDVGGFSKNAEGETIPKPEGHPFLRLTRVVEKDHVFTIEPGLYFIDTLLADLKKSDAAKHVNWSKVDSFRKFGGVRIEDDLVVTEGGHENLTRDEFAKQG